MKKITLDDLYCQTDLDVILYLQDHSDQEIDFKELLNHLYQQEKILYDSRIIFSLDKDKYFHRLCDSLKRLKDLDFIRQRSLYKINVDFSICGEGDYECDD